MKIEPNVDFTTVSKANYSALVLCKDCKHYGFDDEDQPVCIYTRDYVDPNDFCSRGKHRYNAYAVPSDKPVTINSPIVCKESVLEQMLVGQWVSTEYQRPEKDGEYLVTIDGGSMDILNRFVTFGNYFKEFDAWVADNVLFHGTDPVIAWMPLPKPYSGGETERNQKR